VCVALVCGGALAPAAGAATAHRPVRVPNVAGLPKGEVYAALRHAGLYFTTRGPGSASGRWRSATAISPRASTLVAWHSQVTVSVSLAAGHALRRVPALAGRSRAQVYAAMREAQLYFDTTGPGSASGTWVVALGSSPRPGSVVRWHSKVRVRVSTHRPVRHPTTTTRPPHHTTTTMRHVTTTTGAPTATSSTTTSTTYPGETTTSTSSTTSTTSTTVRTTTTTHPRKPAHYRIGLATWYSYVPGRCATSYLPFGTRIWVRDLANGHIITCVVTDRQGSRTGRVADLSETDFSKLTPLWHGVVRVRVWW
jgi:hypothetical protein